MIICPVCNSSHNEGVWSEWSDRYLCPFCLKREDDLHRQADAVISSPPAFWEGKYGCIVLSKVQGWAVDGDNLKVYMDMSDKPFTIALFEATSFKEAFREYWS